jgi:hypothetical protein
VKRACAVALVILGLCVPAADARSRVIRFSVAPDELVRWTSAQTYLNSRDHRIRILRVRVNGHPVGRPVFVTHCSVGFYGRGVIIWALACQGRRSPLALRVATVDFRSAQVAVRYRGTVFSPPTKSPEFF